MKTYLVTGAASGLGKSLTIELINRGQQVILLDKNLKGLNALYDELNSELAALYPIDLLGANIEHYQQLQNTLAETYGQLDGVILNAAILPAFTPIANFDYQQWYEVLHTNLNTNFHLIQATLPLLRQAPHGQLNAIADAQIHTHPAYYGAYGVAKAGLEQLMQTVATEHRNTSLTVSLSRLPAFATEARGRLYPGENPNELPSAGAMATEILDYLLEGRTANHIEKL